MITLRSVITRLAALVRSAGVVYTAIQVTIWHSFYTANSWRLLAPVAAMAWGTSVVLYLRRRSPSPLFAWIDTTFYVALALGAQESVPAGIHDRAYSWVVIGASSQLIVPAWFAPAAFSLLLALASPAAYWVGVWQVAGTQTRITTATVILLVTIAATHAVGRRQLYGRAAAADAALSMADRAASEQFVILSRNIERREHERLLHDTVLNTLTALARSGGDDVAEMVSRCRQDVILIEGALRAPLAADPDTSAESRGGDLAGGVRAVAGEIRARDMTVHVTVAGDGTRSVPATVVTALANATREALTNVAAHAGTREAWVEVAARTAGPVVVTVRDRGTGFDLARADPLRLGLRRSIAERIADCGGQASIRSAPGQGTVVRMSWPAEPAAPASAVSGPAAPALAGVEDQLW
jgi:signal transduction histidine kinase